MERGPRILFRGIARVVASGFSGTGELENLSVGGAFVVLAEALPIGRRLTMTIPLGGGKPPVAAHAVVAWSRPCDDERVGHGLRFVRIDDEAVRRLAELVAGQQTSRDVLLGAVRVRLPGVPTSVRARASERAGGTLVVESDLTWLRMGAPISVEVAPGETRYGRLSWFGIEVAPEGHARILFTVDEVTSSADEDDDGRPRDDAGRHDHPSLG